MGNFCQAFFSLYSGVALATCGHTRSTLGMLQSPIRNLILRIQVSSPDHFTNHM